MSTVPTQIRIDRNIKEQAGALFSELGLDMSGAVNINHFDGNGRSKKDLPRPECP